MARAGLGLGVEVLLILDELDDMTTPGVLREPLLIAVAIRGVRGELGTVAETVRTTPPGGVDIIGGCGTEGLFETERDGEEGVCCCC